MEHSVGTPCWADLSTSDPAKARDFYAAVFGWDYQLNGEEYGFYATARIGDDWVAGIGGQPPESEMPSAWTVYLKTDDVAKTVEQWTAKGGGVLMPPMEVPAMGHMAIVTDPSGAAVGLWQATGHTGFGAMGPHGTTCWFEVNTRESEKVRDFFAGLFDLQSGSSNHDAGTPYWVIQDDRPRYGVLQMNEQWGDMPAHWMVYFQTDDLEATVAKVKEAGGTIHHGPFDTPPGPMAVCADPTGAVFSIISARSMG